MKLFEIIRKIYFKQDVEKIKIKEKLENYGRTDVLLWLFVALYTIYNIVGPKSEESLHIQNNQSSIISTGEIHVLYAYF